MMSLDMFQYVGQPLQNFYLVTLILNGVIHIIFAGAVARDSGLFEKQGIRTSLVSGLTWSFATLLGGVWVAAIYWFIHHSTLTRVS